MDQRRSAVSFRTIIEMSPEGVAVQSGSHLIYVNPALVSMLGYNNRKELIGRATLNLFHPEDRKGYIKRSKSLVESQAAADRKFKARIQSKDGDFISTETVLLHIVFDGLPSTVLMIRDSEDEVQTYHESIENDMQIDAGECAAILTTKISTDVAYATANLNQLEIEYQSFEANLPSSIDLKFRSALKETKSDIKRIRDEIREFRAFYKVEHQVSGRSNQLLDVGTHKQPKKKARVLLIDDEPLLLRSMKRALRGMEIEIAESGKMAKRIIASDRHYDAVICDLVMPDCNGMDVYDYILKMRPKLAHKVVFMTGGVLSIRGDEFIRRVDNKVIGKPFDMKRIRQQLHEVIARA